MSTESVTNVSLHWRLPVGFIVSCRLLPQLCLLGVLLVAGCSKSRPIATIESSPRPDAFRAAVSAGRWEEAWDLSGQVLLESPEDPDTLELVANVAFQSNRQSVAADLLVDAAMATAIPDQRRVQEALAALLAVGRLFDGIDLLRVSVERLPENTTFRRSLFDLLVATCQDTQAKTHIESLVRQRDFDELILLAGYLAESQTEEFSSLDEVMSRNPNDRRPQIGNAKQLMARGEWVQAIDSLRLIVDQHPDFLAAQVLLGRALSLSGAFVALEAWLASVPEGTASDPGYWISVGDLAVYGRDAEAAVQAYARAAKLDLDRVEAWSKLASAMQAVASETADLQAIQERSTQLMKLRQSFAEHVASDQVQPDSLIQITQQLVELGRLWEAEAWAAIGTTRQTFSDVQKRSISELRSGVLAKLTASTPWQSSKRLPSWRWLQTNASIDPIQRSIEVAVDRPTWSVAAPRKVELKNEAVQRGVTFDGRTAGDLAVPGVRNFQMLGCGGAALDFDLDGWPDLYFAAAGGTPPGADSASNAMLRNLNGTFINVATRCGGEDRGFSQGVAVGDLNEDGFDDFVVLNYGPNRLWLNNGDGTFSDHSARWLPDSSTWSTSAAMADLDGDSLSDLVIVNYCDGLGPVTDDCPVGDSNVMRACSPNHFLAVQDDFLRGTMEGGLVDATQPWQAVPELLGRGLGIVAGSFDSQPGVDLLVANDMTFNHYWSARLSTSTGFSLHENGVLKGLASDGHSRSQGSMGIAAADLNLDGDTDFYVSNYESEYNTLYIGEEHSQWLDETNRLGLAEPTMPMVGFGTQAVDLDHNGQCELMVVNGHVDHYEQQDGGVFYAQPAQMFRLSSEGLFESLASSVDDAYFRSVHVGRGLWTLDANRDGLVDFVATHQTEPPALLVNHSTSGYSYVAFRLVATRGSRTAVGSEITIRTKAGTQRGLVISGDGYLCSNERVVRFGLGVTPSNIEVTVRWNNGKTETWTDIQPNHGWLLVQGDAAFKL